VIADVSKNQQETHHMNAEIKDELLDELLIGYNGPEDLLGPEGLFTELKKRLINRILDAELTTHLGYEKHQRPEGPPANARNGHSPKTLQTRPADLPARRPLPAPGDDQPERLAALCPQNWRQT